MQELDQAFDERLTEIDTYLDLLSALEDQVRSGPPKVGATGPVISTTQQRILYSSVYLQLYNLVEATISKCVEAICFAVASGDRWLPSDLSIQIRGEWVRYLAKTHVDMDFSKRLSHSVSLCEHLIQKLPVGQMKIDRGGGGNWHDEEIFRFATRLGCELIITPESNQAVKSPFKDDKGALALIVQLRNDLAHGSLSFGECGANVTVDELRDLRNRTASYMKEVVASFGSFIEAYAFLQSDSRPVGVAA